MKSHNELLSEECSDKFYILYDEYCEKGYDHEDASRLATRDVDAFYEANKK